MAGSDRRSRDDSPLPHHSDWGRLETAILSGWRSFWQSVGKETAAPRASGNEADEGACPLARLPVSGGPRPRTDSGSGWQGLPAREAPGGPPRGPGCVWRCPCAILGTVVSGSRR